MIVFAVDIVGYASDKRDLIIKDIEKNATGADPIIIWDTKVQKVCFSYGLRDTIPLANYGGSLIGPLFDYVEEVFPTAEIVFIYTDGYFGDWDTPVPCGGYPSRYKIILTGTQNEILISERLKELVVGSI